MRRADEWPVALNGGFPLNLHIEKNGAMSTKELYNP